MGEISWEEWLSCNGISFLYPGQAGTSETVVWLDVSEVWVMGLGVNIPLSGFIKSSLLIGKHSTLRKAAASYGANSSF